MEDSYCVSRTDHHRTGKLRGKAVTVPRDLSEQATAGQRSQLRGRFNCERNEPPRITNLRVQTVGRMSRREQERKGKHSLANDAAEHRGRKGSLADDAAEHLGTIRGLFIQLAHRSSRRRARKFPSAATLQRASQMLAVRCN